MENRNNKLLTIILSAVGGLILGVLLTVLLLFNMMPGMMILQGESKLGFDDTVAAIEKAVTDQGWTVQSVINMNKSMAKHGRVFEPQVRVIKLCQPDYAKSILTSDRQMAVMMPCSVSVYEADDGTIMISQLNSGMMGSIFGGNVADVMGGKVDPDMKQILGGVLK